MSGRKSRSAVADFEKQFAELESIVARMERSEQTLDESLADFEKGVALCQSLRSALAEAEQKVQVLVANAGGEKLETFEPPREDES
jgi:exodeoxyribonuclease VII small subunit